MTRVLITGAYGFLGRYAVREFASNGYDVVAFGRDAQKLQDLQESLLTKNNAQEDSLLDWGNIEAYRGDFCDFRAITEASEGVDYIVHCGALLKGWGRKELFLKANVEGTRNVLTACQINHVKRLVYTSSPSAYAMENNLHITEADYNENNHLNHYIESKILAEKHVRGQDKVPYAIIRPRGLCGIGDQNMLPVLINANRTIGMFALANAVTDEEAAPYLEEAMEQLPGFTAIPPTNRRGHAALLCTYRKYAAEHDVAALSSRCWPDCFTEYGTPLCTALSMLRDLGVPAACEGDTYGAVTMLIGAWLSGQAVFFGDPAQLNEEDNTITFWHCGMAAPSLAFEEEGPAVGVHCNRGTGPTMEFGCKGSNRATVLRIGKEKDGTLRLFLCAGEAIGRPRQYHGTSLVVKPDRTAGELVRWAVEDGWEPHFVVAYGDITQEVRALAAMCGIGLWMY